MYNFYVYILANKRHGTLYSGFTNNLIRSVYEHRTGLLSGFTKKHSIKKLVYYEKFDNFEQAVNWSERIKEMPKPGKMELVEQLNPKWNDMYYDIGGDDEYEFYDKIIEKYRKEFAYT
jgi:putative endonuclease